MSCVLTLALDDGAQQRFEELRQRWFPPERNRIPAHVTLFHTLPESHATEEVLSRCAEATPALAVDVQQVRSIGRGVAILLHSTAALALHRDLQSEFAQWLTPQDRQAFRPHVVVQNKVEASVAKETLAIVQAGFVPWTCQAVGLDLWRYLGGPWELLRRFPFQL